MAKATKKKAQPRVVASRVGQDLSGAFQELKMSDGSIKSEPITGEQAALLNAERGF